MKKVALAKIPFKKLSQARLSSYANKHRAAIAAAPGSLNFPDPPFTAAMLTTKISTYNTALAAAYKGSKTQTQVKDQAKTDLITALRANWLYCNQDPSTFSQAYLQYDEQKAFMETSGFSVNGFSTASTGVRSPIIRSITSPEIGVLKVIMNAFSKSGKQRTSRVQGVKTYTLNYRIAASGTTPAGPWLQFLSPSYIITLSGLASGAYELFIVANAPKNLPSPTTTRTVVVL